MIEDIYVIGGTRTQKKYLTDFCEWLVLYLLHEDDIKDIAFEIRIRKMQHDEYGYKGFVQSHLDDNWNYTIFEIELDKNNTKKEMFITLAHEMIHVKQMLQRRLNMKRINDKDVTYWLNEDHTYTKYADRPWEHEANAMQEELVKQYLFDVL